MEYEMIAKAFFEGYEILYDINLITSSYVSLYESEEFKKLSHNSSGDDFFIMMRDIVPKLVHPDDVEYVVARLEREHLVKELEREQHYSFSYKAIRGGRERHHQINAVLQSMPDEPHIILGVKNVDHIMRREKEHREEILSYIQKEHNHMKAILASAEAYMEVNLTKDLVLEKSDDNFEANGRFIRNIPPRGEIPSYTGLHLWVLENLVVENHSKYEIMANREYLLRCFNDGILRTSVLFSVNTSEGVIHPCREVFYLYKNQNSDDVHAFCVIYDLTEIQKKEKEVEQLEHELQMSRIHNFASQMQPHFLYNALGSIQEVILIDPEYASSLLGDFTVHLRSCIRSMNSDEPMPFEYELENIKAYVNIEKMRFGDKLRVHYEIESQDFDILPLTIQPLVENAIRHGIYGRGVEGGEVFVRSWEQDDKWIVQIEDTGIGFDVNTFYSRLNKGNGDSTGIKNVQFRLEVVMNAGLHLSSEVGKGTIVTVDIPKRGKQ